MTPAFTPKRGQSTALVKPSCQLTLPCSGVAGGQPPRWSPRPPLNAAGCCCPSPPSHPRPVPLLAGCVHTSALQPGMGTSCRTSVASLQHVVPRTRRPSSADPAAPPRPRPHSLWSSTSPARVSAPPPRRVAHTASRESVSSAGPRAAGAPGSSPPHLAGAIGTLHAPGFCPLPRRLLPRWVSASFPTLHSKGRAQGSVLLPPHSPHPR